MRAAVDRVEILIHSEEGCARVSSVAPFFFFFHAHLRVGKNNNKKGCMIRSLSRHGLVRNSPTVFFFTYRQ